jgi:hypothetical protein
MFTDIQESKDLRVVELFANLRLALKPRERSRI